MKMLLARRGVDVLILEQEAADDFIRGNKIQSIQRQLYKRLDSTIVVAKNAQGAELSRQLSQYISYMKAQPKYQKTISNIHQPYDNWQP